MSTDSPRQPGRLPPQHKAHSTIRDQFLALSSDQRRQILDTYESQFGTPARTYAEQTTQRWQAGTVKMSSVTTDRLSDLLPAQLTLQSKYELAGVLWRESSPRSHYRLEAAADADADNVMAMVTEHFTSMLTKHDIPAVLRDRFSWLNDQDVQVHTDILRHLTELELEQKLGAADNQLRLLLTYNQHTASPLPAVRGPNTTSADEAHESRPRDEPAEPAAATLRSASQSIAIAGQRLDVLLGPHYGAPTITEIATRAAPVPKIGTDSSPIGPTMWFILCMIGALTAALLLS